MKISLITAMAANRCIGLNNAMPWHVPEDFKYFKATTMGKPMIMGRKTFESLPGVLPGRPHFIVSRQNETEVLGALKSSRKAPREDIRVFDSLETAIDEAEHWAKEHDVAEVFIVGGAQIYTQALDKNLIDRLYITELEASYEGDAFFPEFDRAKWRELSRDEKQEPQKFAFVVYERL